MPHVNLRRGSIQGRSVSPVHRMVARDALCYKCPREAAIGYCISLQRGLYRITYRSLEAERYFVVDGIRGFMRTVAGQSVRVGPQVDFCESETTISLWRTSPGMNGANLTGN